ncbi:MAG: MFS family permease [Bradymonadia bacterium]|jgi:MFS family permease
MGAQFLQSLGYSSMLLLPLYLNYLGASRTEIGAIMGAAAVGGLGFRPLVAWSLDRVGRKPTLVVGTLVLAVSVAALGLISSIGPAVYFVRAAIGVGIGALFTGYFTFAADFIPTHRRTEGLALFGIFGLLGLLVNPLAEVLNVQGAELRGFYPVIGVVILTSLLLLRLVPEQRKYSAKGAEPFDPKTVFRALTVPALRPVWVASAVFSGMVATYMSFVTVAAGDAGVARPALLWGTYTLGATAVRLFGARLPDKVGPSNLVAPALGFYVAALLVAASARAEQGFLVSGLLAGIGHGYCFPVLSGQVVTRVADRFRGSGLAVFTGLWELVRVVLTPAFGALADHYNDSVMFAGCAALGVFGLAAWLLLEMRVKPGDG